MKNPLKYLLFTLFHISSLIISYQFLYHYILFNKRVIENVNNNFEQITNILIKIGILEIIISIIIIIQEYYYRKKEK